MSFESTGGTIDGAPGAVLVLGDNRSIALRAGSSIGLAEGLRFPSELTPGSFNPEDLTILAYLPTLNTADLYGRFGIQEPVVIALHPASDLTLGEVRYNQNLASPSAITNTAGQVVGSVTSEISRQVEGSFRPGRIDQVILFGFQGDLSLAPPPVFGAIRGVLLPVVEGGEDDRKKKP